MLTRLIRSYRDSWGHAGRAGRWFLVAGFFYATRLLVFTVSFPLFAKERGFSSSQVGLLLACMALSLFVFGIPITKLGSRGHARIQLILGPLLAALGLLTILLAPGTSFAIVAFGCLLSGMASNVFWILGDPILAAVVPPGYQARVFAIKFALLTIGFGAGGALGGWVPAVLERTGASAETALGGALVVVIILDLIQVFCYRQIPLHETHSSRAEPARSTHFNRRNDLAVWGVFLLLLVPEMGMATGYNSLRPFLSLFFDEEFGLAPGRTGTIIGIMQLVGGMSALLIPTLALRLGNVRTMAMLRFLAGSMVLLIAGAPGLPVVLLLLFSHYSVVDGTEATFITEAMTRLPAARRTAFAGLSAMVWSVCSAIASSLSGFLQDRTGGFDATFVLSASAFMFSGMWLAFAYPRIPSLLDGDSRAAPVDLVVAQVAAQRDEVL